MALGFEVEADELSMLVQPEAGYFVCLWIARSDA
jgi:hypothetical protein